MSTEYSPFARPTFTAADFARDEPASTVRPEHEAVSEEPRSFSMENSFNEPEKTDDQPMFAGTPIYARSTRAKSSGPSIRPALMIGVPAVVLAAGVAYFAMQPRQTIFADPVPATAAVEPLTAPATTPATPAPTQLAAADPPALTPEVPATTPAPTVRAEPPARVARARPAPRAQDASSFAADASATPPAAPIPYSSLGQTSAPAPGVAPAPIIVPPASPPTAADAAPTPAETTPAPEPAIPDPATPPPTLDIPTP